MRLSFHSFSDIKGAKIEHFKCITREKKHVKNQIYPTLTFSVSLCTWWLFPVLPVVVEFKAVNPNPLLHYPFLQENALDLSLWCISCSIWKLNTTRFLQQWKYRDSVWKNYVSNKQSTNNLLLKHHFLQHIDPLFSSPSAMQLMETKVIVNHFSTCLEEMKSFPMVVMNCFCSWGVIREFFFFSSTFHLWSLGVYKYELLGNQEAVVEQDFSNSNGILPSISSLSSVCLLKSEVSMNKASWFLAAISAPKSRAIICLPWFVVCNSEIRVMGGKRLQNLVCSKVLQAYIIIWICIHLLQAFSILPCEYIHEKSVKIGQDQGQRQCLWAVFVVLTLVCLVLLMSA